MASLQQLLRIIKKPAMRYRMHPMYQLLTRSASDEGPQGPPIKPPGPEWVPGKWEDDGTGFGDYPNYTEWSYQHRDPRPAVPYFEPQDRRYFGEPLHVHDDALNRWMPDDGADINVTPHQMLLHLTIAFSILGGIVWYSEYIYDAKSHDPVVQKPYPYNNLYIERGGDPDKEPTEAELNAKMVRPMYGW